MSYKIFCMGNPLLDIQVRDGEKLLAKYDLLSNNAILANDKHQPLYKEIVDNFEVTYVAGGAAQNAARGAAYVLPAGQVVYTGAVGNDDLADQLRAANKREGLDEVYLVKEGEQTGACAVIITNLDRSLVTTLRAAEKFEVSHLKSDKVAPLIASAELFYVESFFLTHGVESVRYLSQLVSASNKTFALNLSAPFILEFFKAQLEEVLPYTDIVIGNEAEAEAFAKHVLQQPTDDIVAIARGIAGFAKANARPRVVVITQGAQSTIVVDSAGKTKEYAVTPIPKELIKDTNGAGDAFSGAFLGAYVSGRDLDSCVNIGHQLAGICVQEVGPQYKWPKVKLL